MKTYVIQEKENSSYITEESDRESAIATILRFEREDRVSGIYTPDFYEIREVSYTVSMKKLWTPDEGSLYLDWCGESFENRGDIRHFATREEAARVLSRIEPGEFSGWQFIIEEHSGISDDSDSELVEKRDLPYS